MNIISVNLHGYCSKFANLHNYIWTDVGHFQEKLCKFYTFFYYKWTGVNALTHFKSIQSLNNNLVIMTLLLTSLYKYNKIIYGSSIIINQLLT